MTALAQPSFADLGVPLSQVTFCVVDLETTGGSKDSEITEIGAVKVAGGEVLGEFQTLVRPQTAIPALIQVLTGITNPMVASAPDPAEAIAAFAEFCTGCVLVAHNARFDVGFLKRAYEALGLTWHRPQVIDTVALARQALLRDEVRNFKLATLAEHFQTKTTPNHRALSDARATVDVLHGLLERLGNLAVHTLEDLVELLSRVSPERRAKRGWAQQAPELPGIYWFVHEKPGASEPEILYVGKSKNLKQRVRSYFSAAEQRSRIDEMVRVATGLRFMPCETELEAEIRELRMIAAHAPRYNRRSKNQNKLQWLKLTNEPFPRLSVVSKIRDDGAPYWGPFSNRDQADQAMNAVYEGFGIRQCTKRLSATKATSPCALAELGRCSAPCQLDPAAHYDQLVERVLQTWRSDVTELLRRLRPKLQRLIRAERFEEAGILTERLRAYYRVSLRHHRFTSLARCPQMVAAAPQGDGWAIHVFRFGKLAAAGWAVTAAVTQTAAALIEFAETVLKPVGPAPAGSVEEAERIAAWLELPEFGC